MKKKWLLAALVLITGICTQSFTKHDAGEEPLVRQQTLLMTIGRLLQEKHYSPREINDQFSQTVWTKYLNQLDPDKRFFLREDVDSLQGYATLLDDEISGKAPISFLPAALGRYAKRLQATDSLCRQLLSAPFQLMVKEAALPPADSIDFATSTAAWRQLNHQYLKYQVLENFVALQSQRDKSKTGDSLYHLTDTQLEKKARQKVSFRLSQYFTRLTTYSQDEQQQFDTYVNVMVRCMDPHTDYFPPVEKQAFDESMSNRFFGIGAQIRMEDGLIKLGELTPGSPAEKSGQVQQNDQILRIGHDSTDDMTDVAGMLLPEVVKLIRGTKGTKVRLELKKTDGTVKLVTLIRDEIVAKDGLVRSAVVHNGNKKTGYIYLPLFYDDFAHPEGAHCAADMAKAVMDLKAEGVDGIVIDLRSNGGGSLREVVRMAGLFIRSGPVVQVRNGDGQATVLDDRDDRQLYDGPLLVMVNELSASASEIFAAAMQDYHRAVIMGSSSTYGKGTVQSPLKLSNTESSALKLTIQKFYRINGGSTQLKGVTPDVILPDMYEYMKVREKDNAAALPWDQIASATYIPVAEKVSFSTLAQHAAERIRTDSAFATIQRLSALTQSSHYTNRVLDLAGYNALQALRQKTVADALQAQKLPAGKTVDVQALTGSDQAKDTHYQQWLQKLSADVYLNQAVQVVQEME